MLLCHDALLLQIQKALFIVSLSKAGTNGKLRVKQTSIYRKYTSLFLLQSYIVLLCNNIAVRVAALTDRIKKTPCSILSLEAQVNGRRENVSSYYKYMASTQENCEASSTRLSRQPLYPKVQWQGFTEHTSG